MGEKFENIFSFLGFCAVFALFWCINITVLVLAYGFLLLTSHVVDAFELVCKNRSVYFCSFVPFRFAKTMQIGMISKMK